MSKPTYSPEEEVIYHADCQECIAWETFVEAERAGTKALRQAKAWARHHIDDEHDGSGASEYVQISRVVGNVA